MIKYPLYQFPVNGVTPFDEYKTAAHGDAILDAVETLNGEGIIHGAVSPDTLFLCSDGKFKLLSTILALTVLSIQKRNI